MAKLSRYRKKDRVLKGGSMMKAAISCFVCAGDVQSIHSETTYDEVRCDDCGVTYVAPPPPPTVVIEAFGADPIIHFSHGREEVLAKFLRCAETLSHERKRGLLDVGCGAGTFLNVARRSGWTVSGVDINPVAIRVAKEHFDLQVTPGTIFDVVGLFDLITFMQAVEYMPGDHAQVFATARRLLSTDGLLGVETPNLDFHQMLLRFKSARSQDKALRIAPQCGSRLTPRAIRQLLKQVGFRNVWIFPGVPRKTEGVIGRLARNILYWIANVLFVLSRKKHVLSPTMFVFAQR